MRSAHLTVRVDDIDPGTAFDRIKDFSRYPELSDVVRSVTVHEVTDDEESSDWEVYFRNGILTWSEADRFDRDALRISFSQLDGDFADFSGTWQITPDADGCLVAFTAEFDFGIPSLAGILDPVAERVLKETIARVVVSLFETAAVVGDDTLARAVAAAPVAAGGR
ncbi:cyclase [Wenjunlia vitaminophila]|uniref:Cyclase n=1 Tax=Wenjunlia vitaminophila TaxID=76728 RepID=A0A0T6LK87_WENVI|nr:SRPBCC family protein [Wenjunlia vitaminophila]KRV46509.1 cyclase [Wenjunlia vitaminophila]